MSAAAGLAWLAMLAHAWNPGLHAHHAGSPVAEWASWLAMIAAMMLPLLTPTLREVAARSLWRRRHRAMLVFLGGYFAPWAALGGAVAALRMAPWARAPAAAPIGFAIAAAWACTPAYAAATAAGHHLRPLAPRGWAADADCLRSGLAVGAACVATCWALMAACACSGHDAIAMVGGFALGWAERRTYRPDPRWVPAGAAALGLWYAARAATIG